MEASAAADQTIAAPPELAARSAASEGGMEESPNSTGQCAG